MDISLAIAIISVIIAVSNFVLSRKDKSNKDAKEQQQSNDSHVLMDYRLKKIEEQLEKILSRIDSFEKDMKKIVQEEIKRHEELYHK